MLILPYIQCLFSVSSLYNCSVLVPLFVYFLFFNYSAHSVLIKCLVSLQQCLDLYFMGDYFLDQEWELNFIVLLHQWRWLCVISCYFSLELPTCSELWIDFLTLDLSGIPELNPAYSWHVLSVDWWVPFDVVFKVFMFISRSESSL